jgi:hypothetical protein
MGQARMRRGWPAVLTAAAVAVSATACTPTIEFIDPTLTGAVLTAYNADTQRVEVAGGRITVRAPAANTEGSIRIAFVPSAQVPSRDQESCATWEGGAGDGFRQEGIVLRMATDANGVTRAITVTKNVWDYNYALFNVHLWDTSRPAEEADGRARLLANVDLSKTFGPKGSAPFPWRMCAQAVGAKVAFTVWPLAGGEPVPGNAAYGGTVDVPPEWVYEGRAGWYAGHLQPGATLVYSGLLTRRLQPWVVLPEFGGIKWPPSAPADGSRLP